MTDYKDIIIDHYKNPRNFGTLDNADVSMDEANSSCGDMIRIQVKKDGERIVEMKWQGVGCAISTASASMLSEKIVGMNKKDLEDFGEKGIVDLLGGEVNPGRMKCATLAYRGLLNIFNSDE